MANSALYEAKLKARRWIEPIHLGLGDITPLSRDMTAVLAALEGVGKEMERLRKREVALKTRRQPVPAKQAQDLRALALRIAELLGEGPLSVYRGPKGGVAWCAPSKSYEGELIGTYDEGADWRDILSDLEA